MHEKGPILGLRVCSRCFSAVQVAGVYPCGIRERQAQSTRELPPPSPHSRWSRTAVSFHSRETTETQEADKTETSH